MPGVTSVTLGGLEIEDGIDYAVGNETLDLLEAMTPYQPVMVDMNNRHPVFVRSQIQARPISLSVMLLATDAFDRKAAYDALIAAADPSLGLVELTWTDDSGTRTLLVHASAFIPSNWFSRATAEMIAPNPVPVSS